MYCFCRNHKKNLHIRRPRRRNTCTGTPKKIFYETMFHWKIFTGTDSGRWFHIDPDGFFFFPSSLTKNFMCNTMESFVQIPLKRFSSPPNTKPSSNIVNGYHDTVEKAVNSSPLVQKEREQYRSLYLGEQQQQPDDFSPCSIQTRMILLP